MHRSVLDFAHRVLTSDVVLEKTVLEVGSGIVNGSVRSYVCGLNPARYLGVDTAEGLGVDVVAPCERLTEHVEGQWDIVISTEMLEHVRDWRACMEELAKVVAPGGMLVITTRSPGFAYHAYPEDHWRYTVDNMADILTALDLEAVVLEKDPEAFGVFVVARKPPVDWNPTPGELVLIELMQMGPHRQSEQLQVQEVSGQKLVIAFPLYRQIPVSWFFNWLQMKKDHLVGTVATEGMYLPQAMETLVAMAFEYCPDFDRLVVMEHDMIPPLDAFNRIAQYGPEHDIVGSTYFKHEHPYHVMAWMQVDKPRFSPLTRDRVRTLVENPGLYEVDGVAMGLTSIARHVFEDWNSEVPMWTPTPPLIGHDLHFCHEAKKQGFRVWLDSGIGCGHLTLVPIGYGDSQEALSEDEPDTWAEALGKGNPPALDRVM